MPLGLGISLSFLVHNAYNYEMFWGEMYESELYAVIR